MNSISCRGINIGHKNFLLKDVKVSLSKGSMTAIIGPNGSGKTTLLKGLSGLLSPLKGNIFYDENNLKDISLKSLAKKRSVFSQILLSTPLTVKKLCEFGRYPYRKMFCPLTTEDEQIIEDAMKATNITHLAQRSLQTLSGGQQQRVYLAMALAQNTPWLFLDEPTNYLDVRYQIELLELLQKLNLDSQLSIVMVLHDLNLALMYCEDIIVIHNGSVVAHGKGQNILTESLVQKVYGLKVSRFRPQPHGPYQIFYHKKNSVELSAHG